MFATAQVLVGRDTHMRLGADATLRFVDLNFPANRAVGTVDWGQAWDVTHGPTLATGTVAIPDGLTITLRVSAVTESVREGDAWQISHDNANSEVDLGFLEDLPPDAVSSLTLGWVDESTFASVRHLKPGLNYLYLSGDFSDDVLPHVASLSGLIWLQTYGNYFTDTGVQQLVALQRLQSLYLEEPSLSIAAFEFVPALPDLTRLGLQDVPLTKRQLKSLRERLPGVDVG